jgi:hypothetical protein
MASTHSEDTAISMIAFLALAYSELCAKSEQKQCKNDTSTLLKNQRKHNKGLYSA